MSTKKTIDLYLIKNLSNLHVGRGDSNYGIVDNEVQRDPVQGVPVIFSSSIKGALREAVATELGPSDPVVLEIFGNEVNGNGNLQPGSHIFHEARLLSMPVRADTEPYFNATASSRLQELAELLKLLTPKAEGITAEVEQAARIEAESGTPRTEMEVLVDEFQSTKLSQEDKSALNKLAKRKLFSDPVAYFSNKDFNALCERLPVIARNQLDKGVSKNLFYEEVVPRQSRFLLFVERPENDKDKLFECLDKKLNMRVQLGANATIGYGVCQFERILLT
ncbi:MAG: type III-B CRISPR module RAMP protein Cmr4 [Phaeodactylibacter sp.]|nr:type III-B CRISPR module RAMP protein Cmr4 [Phaeodactylibacter sp.]